MEKELTPRVRLLDTAIFKASFLETRDSYLTLLDNSSISSLRVNGFHHGSRARTKGKSSTRGARGYTSANTWTVDAQTLDPRVS